MNHQPPISTLFPYTTLFRSFRGSKSPQSGPSAQTGEFPRSVERAADQHHGLAPFDVAAFRQLANRSEEHTSELQSQFHLVCRLALEMRVPNAIGYRVPVAFF